MRSSPLVFALCIAALAACSDSGDDASTQAPVAAAPTPAPAEAAPVQPTDHAPYRAPVEDRPFTRFAADCPGNVHVAVGKDGVLKINDVDALLESVGERYYEATDPTTGIVLGITVPTDGSRLAIAYTSRTETNGKQANAACKLLR